MKKVILTVLTVAIAGAALQPAYAGDREWATAGKILTGVAVGAVIAKALTPEPEYVYAPAPTYVYTPAPAYTYAPPPPAPVVYVPAPVVVAPAPVVYAPAPVVYAPAPVVYAPPQVVYVAPPPRVVYRPPMFVHRPAAVVSFHFGGHHGHGRGCR